MPSVPAAKATLAYSCATATAPAAPSCGVRSEGLFMDRKRKRAEPQRPLTAGRGGAAAEDGGGTGGQSDYETAKGSLSFIARVLTQSQEISRQRISELATEQEKHGETRRARQRAEAERADALSQLCTARQSLSELSQEVQSERVRHEATRQALVDERAAHALTEKARQQAQDRLNGVPQQPLSNQPSSPTDRRESAAGVGSSLAQRPQPQVHSHVHPAPTSETGATVTAARTAPSTTGSLAEATRQLGTPFRRNVNSLQSQLGRHDSAQPTAKRGATSWVADRDADYLDTGADDYQEDALIGAGEDTEDNADSGSGDDIHDDHDEQVSDDSPVQVSPRPARNRQPPHRWQDGKSRRICTFRRVRRITISPRVCFWDMACSAFGLTRWAP